jgi:1-deoxy-D-xylulose-5-phosphate reductoisomerase
VLTPIDSEHSAIFQCLQGYSNFQIAKIYLTASGGPFRGKKKAELANVTVEEALNHPTWRMGGKITIDSATLFNKALELIEARWLFGVPGERIEVIVHPQSVVHSMVQFLDGSVLGQLGFPDMRLPIKYALLYPERLAAKKQMWSPLDSPNLTFEALDEEVFPSIELARHVLSQGGTMAAAFNAANEEAANAFLRNEIGFADIYSVVEAVCNQDYRKDLNFDSIYEVDRDSRAFSRKLMEDRSHELNLGRSC